MRPEYQLFASLPLVHCRRASPQKTAAIVVVIIENDPFCPVGWRRLINSPVFFPLFGLRPTYPRCYKAAISSSLF